MERAVSCRTGLDCRGTEWRRHSGEGSMKDLSTRCDSKAMLRNGRAARGSCDDVHRLGFKLIGAGGPACESEARNPIADRCPELDPPCAALAPAALGSPNRPSSGLSALVPGKPHCYVSRPSRRSALQRLHFHLGANLSHRLALQVQAMRVVYEPIKDCIRNGLVGEESMPGVNWVLTCHQ